MDAALRPLLAAHDFVHVHALWDGIQRSACATAQETSKPYVVTPHGMLTPWSLGQKRLKKWAYLTLLMKRHLNTASALHFTSTAERDATARAIELRPPVIVEPLGVDLAEFATLPPPGSFRSKLGALGEKKMIVFLGRLHPGKGMEYLLPALARMKRRDAVLIAVGPDSNNFRAELERRAAKLGLNGRVHFAGMLRGSERIAALADADLFALPSEHENFGIVVVEALASGTPVIVSDGVALHTEVTMGQVGASVRVGDIVALAVELDRWLDDDDLRNAAARRARAFASERFDWSKIAARWVDHYQRLRGS
jgi:glycosyltransferase involved in cell wall biosynthesis